MDTETNTVTLTLTLACVPCGVELVIPLPRGAWGWVGERALKTMCPACAEDILA